MTGLKFEKNQIREEVLKKRLDIPSDIRDKADMKMCERLFSLASFRFAETVLLYFPIKCEPDALRIMDRIISAGKKVALPKCYPETFFMQYKYISSVSELCEGAYGIMEPDENAQNYEPSEFKNDICIVPAVCFDKHGYRIGYGKGYYDRFLSNFGGTSIGFTMSTLLFEELPKGKYDRSVDLIITEKGVISPS